MFLQFKQYGTTHLPEVASPMDMGPDDLDPVDVSMEKLEKEAKEVVSSNRARYSSLTAMAAGGGFPGSGNNRTGVAGRVAASGGATGGGRRAMDKAKNGVV